MNIPTWAYINAAPNPIGVGQTVAVYMWLTNLFDGESLTNNYRFHNYMLTITSPNGVVTTQKWDYISDPTSSQSYTFTPDQVGTYTLNFTFPGQAYTQYDYNPTSTYVNDMYLPSSAATTLTVQQDPIPSPASYPLPSEYWAHPISAQNTEWYQIGSNYVDPNTAAYSFGAIRYVPGATAPNSGHVMWTNPIQFGGLVGANSPYNDTAYYTGLSYETRFQTLIIISGNLYFGLPLSGSGTGGGYVDIDLQTGRQVWIQNYAVNPSFGILINIDTGNQHGVIGYLIAVAGSTWIAYDPYSGNWLFNITNDPSGVRQYGPNGEPEIYQLNRDDAGNWLALWNFTDVIANGPENFLLSTGWRPVGQVFDSTKQLSCFWNVTLPALPSGSNIKWAVDGDILLGSDIPSNQFGGIPRQSNTVLPSTATIFELSLNPSTLGQLLWQKTTLHQITLLPNLVK